MSQTTLVIVESPGKVKKISKFLGSGYQVAASVGHVRQLADTGENNTGVALSSNPPQVTCEYTPVEGASKRLQGLKRQARGASEVILATDPDREGEAIAWHLAEVLGLNSPKRARFSEITEAAIKKAIAHPEALDENLAAAARARDVLDKLVGYQLSPLLWELGNGAKSAGRCQSAALHLLCQREREIERFQPQTFWTVKAEFAEGFAAEYEDSDGSRRCFDRKRAQALAQAIRESSPYVSDLKRSCQTRTAPPPLTTSTLQQEANKRLGFSSGQTMRFAQKLYEAGAITYHRTDSVELSPEFCAQARDWLQANAPDAVPKQTSKHRNRSGAQAAHEAIRPTQVERRDVDISDGCQQLYQLIWARAIASQCAPAQVERVSVVVLAESHRLVASGQRLLKAGYTVYWNNLKADNPLPELSEEQALTLERVDSHAAQTKPPERISEAKLVSRLESEGIGRPSTYASIVATLLGRKYVERQRGQLVPTQLGREVDNFLGRTTPALLEPAWTAAMERSLDAIARGETDWQAYIVGWHEKEFLPALEKGAQIAASEFAPPSDEVTTHICQMCEAPGLLKRYSNSPKLETDHYLVCSSCESPHFWSNGEYQLPYKLRRRAGVKPENLTDHECPECQAKLEWYCYQRDGQTREMLRCSQLQTEKCSDVAFFPVPAGWRSRQHGILVEGQTVDFASLI